MDDMSDMRRDNPSDAWEPCPPGALSQLAQRQVHSRSISRSLTIATAAVGGAACVLLLLGSMGVVGLNSLYPLGGSSLDSESGVMRVSAVYSCRDAINCRDSFLLGSASAEVQASVREHLGHCAHCQTAYRQRAHELKVEYTVLVSPSSAGTAFASRW